MRGWRDVTMADIAKLQRKDATSAKPSKYRNTKVMTPDGEFDSKKEYAHWLGLKTRATTGEISELSRQTAFALHCPVSPGVYAKVCEYRCDFRYKDRAGLWHVEDVKSSATRTPLYRLKAKWMNLEHGIEVEEI